LFSCAFECEAKPIIEHFQMKQICQQPFKIWQSETSALVVSGLGKRAMSEAVAYCSGFFEHLEAFINIGVAGHKEEEIGKGFLAHQVLDANTNARYYPIILFPSPVPTTSLITVDRLEQTFPTSSLYEMEASAFFATASRFTTFELIHSFKIVSDNLQKPFSLNQHAISSFIKAHCLSIERIVHELFSLLKQLPLSLNEDLKSLFSSLHFTHSERFSCKRLVERYVALCSSEIPWSELKSCRSVKEILFFLEKEIKDLLRN